MVQKSILFINGIPDDLNVKVGSIQKNGHPLLIYNGGANIFNFIEDKTILKNMLILDANNTQDIQLTKSSAIFNQISDADTHKISLEKLKNIYKFFPKNTPVFNSPYNILNTTRDNMYELIKNTDKINIPKTVKIQPKSPEDIFNSIKKELFQFPLIFRKSGDHGGISTILVNNISESFYAFALDGRDYYLTQFVDYQADNIYTKYRLVVVEGKVYLRHVIFSDNWIIHSGSREYMSQHKKYRDLEADMLNSFENSIKPNIQKTITSLYKATGLDYFGIDCNIDKNFNILIFELNANMNVLTNTSQDEINIWQEPIKKIINAITLMIHKA